jgi:hypothetical protein
MINNFTSTIKNNTTFESYTIYEDIGTAKTLEDCIKIDLNSRALLILQKQKDQEENEKKKELNKQKPKIKWYNQFKKNKRDFYE